ncbi:hypothetical protein [Halobacteriovorax sp. GB3]|uniref:hypothetical protein n=1 Tax=Halobacteriovorax sp. GB3 TaxID=2719615 RepID=UPI00235F244E|nr:hypothetical protein [Halobacteriovorax sp. GB3]
MKLRWYHHFFSLGIAICILMVMSGFYFYNVEENQELRIKSYIASIEKSIMSEVRLLNAIVLSFKSDKAVLNFLNSKNENEELKKFLDHRVKTTLFNFTNINQFRLLDVNGLEVYRLNSYGGTILFVDKRNLQDKSNRYYYKEMIELNRYSSYFSMIDFNIEQGRVQYPLTTMMRAGTNIYSSEDVRVGSIIININMDKVLKDAQIDEKVDFSIINAKGEAINGDKFFFSSQAEFIKSNGKLKNFDEESLKKVVKEKSQLFRKVLTKKIDLSDQQYIFIAGINPAFVDEQRWDYFFMAFHAFLSIVVFNYLVFFLYNFIKKGDDYKKVIKFLKIESNQLQSDKDNLIESLGLVSCEIVEPVNSLEDSALLIEGFLDSQEIELAREECQVLSSRLKQLKSFIQRLKSSK